VIYDIFERIHNIIKNKTFISNGKEFNITLSFGINCYLNNIENLNDNIKKADLALYKAKKERNKIVIYSEKNKKEFCLNKEEFLDLIYNKKMNFILIPIFNSNQRLVNYFSKFYLHDNNTNYFYEDLEGILNTDQHCYNLWLKLCFEMLEKYYNKKEKIFFNLKASKLIEKEFFMLLLDKSFSNLILNIDIDINETNIIFNKLNKLINKYEISLKDNNTHKEEMFSIIKHYDIKYLYSKTKKYDYIFFLIELAETYNLKIVLTNKIIKNDKILIKKELK